MSTAIIDHYSQSDQVLPRILAGFAQKGQPIESVKVEDLSAVDEFHIGGVPAALALFNQLNLQYGHAVLDVGCGLGGPARLCAAARGCFVTGVDLTPEYVAAGNLLSAWPAVALQDQVSLVVGDATDLAASGISEDFFDAGYMLHVGMVKMLRRHGLFDDFHARVLLVSCYYVLPEHCGQRCTGGVRVSLAQAGREFWSL
jgi:SAM-dependent methyltransferase